MLATVGMTVAQDIWSCGEHNNGSKTGVGIYKNGERVVTLQNADYNFTAYDITRWNEHTYLAYRNDTYGHAYIYDYENSSAKDLGADTYAYKLFGRTNLYAAGYRKNGSVYNATIWKLNAGSTPTVLFTWDNGSYNTYAYCGLIGPDTYNYAGGYQYTGSDSWVGVIWKESTGVLYTFPQEKSYVLDMAYYDGSVYSLVATNASSTKWVYCDNDLLYTITAASSSIRDLHIESGDIYVCGYEDNQIKVWKNGEAYWTSTVGSSHIHGVWANSEGVYFCGKIGSNGTIWKDGTAIHQPSGCTVMRKLYVEDECANSDVRSLPFTDGFENGSTSWPCWTKLDVDGDNGVNVSYWDRVGKRLNSSIPEGDHCAWHRYNGDNNQEGWLISPRLFLQPGRDNTTLTFKTYEGYASDYRYEGVWVSTNSDPTSTSSYTEVWTQSSPSASWKTVTVDLSAYQGQAIYIAFKYTGTNGHNWLIDDVSVTEEWLPCTSYPLPFEETFNGEIELCWYNIDIDCDPGIYNNRYNWQYDELLECAYHPWGSNNGVVQQGALITPKIDLTTGSHFKLSFDHYRNFSGSDMANSVWVALDQTGVPNWADFVKLWDDTEFPTSWTTVELDLTAYAGHTINIAFYYEGMYAHKWCIDNVKVEESTMWYNINVNSNNTAWGTVTGGGTYEEGTSVTIEATPATGYEFVKWTKGGIEVSTSASYTFTATENATFTAVFGEPAVTYYTVVTGATPAEGGTVDGGGTYASGTEITLVANASEGWHFEKWQDNNTDNPRTVTVTGDATFTATFAKNQYTVTLEASPIEGGTVEGGGTYLYGTNIQLMATANEGYTFTSWSDGVSTRVRFMTVVEPVTLTAYFTEVGATTYTVTVLSNDATLGDVTGGGTYPEGATVTLTAMPKGSAVFQKWDDGATDNPRTVTVTGDATYTAVFVMPTMYTITVETMNPEMGTVMGGGTFASGTEVTIQAMPKGGYYFIGWTDGNLDNPRTVTVTGDATYKAKFSAQQAQTYTLTVMCNASEGAVTGNGTYAAGTAVTVQAIPYEGYEFAHWNDGSTQNPRTVTVNENMTMVAFFAKTGVNEHGERALSVYPNPVNSTLFIEGLEPNSNVLIYNTLGMLVKSVNTDKEVNVSDLAAGVYMIRCGSQILRFVKK